MIQVLFRFFHMKNICLLIAFFRLVLMPASGLCIQPDDDLGLIPDDVTGQRKHEPNIAKSEKYHVKAFLEEVAVANIRRDVEVPIPGQKYTDWNNRLDLDVRADIQISPNLSTTIADRAHYLLENDPERSGGTINNDLKESFLSVNALRLLYLDAGRINVKNGVALGFNPTDYFKKNAVSYKISGDPTVLRENRLGVLMARVQGIWEKAAVTIAFAPEVSRKPGRWWTDAGDYGLRLDRTNTSNRYLCKLTLNAYEDFNPELLFFRDRTQSNFGVNLTKGIGDAMIVYSEWNGSNRPNITTQAIDDAVDAGTVPQGSLSFLDIDQSTHFQHQLVIGLSYTEKIKRTTHLEYHYNSAGFSHADWKEWFVRGSNAKILMQDPSTHATGQQTLELLWAFRQWSEDAQEPVSRHSLFIRTFWEDAFTDFLDITEIVKINVMDGSFYMEPTVSYHLRKNLTLSLSANLFFGHRESEYGSLNPMGAIKGGATVYF